jgi:hypothetical protein
MGIVLLDDSAAGCVSGAEGKESHLEGAQSMSGEFSFSGLKMAV